MERKLATIRTIAEVKAIPEADSICAYRVDGWWVVDLVDMYKVGDKVVYAEPDSWIPTELAPFLSKGKEPREFEGVKGERLRTIKLRGQLSQGLLLPYAILGTKMYVPDHAYLEDGLDVSEPLGIIKWEAPIPACLAGEVKGMFPSFIKKTDQERIQNMPEILLDTETEWEVTIKMDGSSGTNYYRDGYFGVCSRNLDLKEAEGNTFWSTAKKICLDVALPAFGHSIAIQGELMGEGIQKNQEKIQGHKFFVFDIFNIDRFAHVGYDERKAIITELNRLGAKLEAAPFIEITTLAKFKGSMEAILAYAEGMSYNPAVQREGVVFKSLDGTKSFKVISNKWLLKADSKD